MPKPWFRLGRNLLIICIGGLVIYYLMIGNRQHIKEMITTVTGETADIFKTNIDTGIHVWMMRFLGHVCSSTGSTSPIHREKRTSADNVTNEEASSSTNRGSGNTQPKWIQTLSTILCILIMFGLIMAAVACNVWCLDGDDDLSSRGDSILDLELASSLETTD